MLLAHFKFSTLIETGMFSTESIKRIPRLYTDCTPMASSWVKSSFEESKSESEKRPKSTPLPLYGKKTKFRAPTGWESKVSYLATICGKEESFTAFAVVTDVYPAQATRGTDYRMTIGIADPSYERGKRFKVHFFQSDTNNFPVVNVGDVIKFPFRVLPYQGCPEGRGHDGAFPWMAFDGAPDAPIEPRFSTNATEPYPRFSKYDKERVEMLKKWADENGLGPAKPATLSELQYKPGYYDIVAQVIHVEQQPDVLRVWDGTQPSAYGLMDFGQPLAESATRWGAKVIGKCVDISIYGYDLLSTCKVGDYVELPGVHLQVDTGITNGSNVVFKAARLTIHEHNKRRIKVLDPSSMEVLQLEERMAELPAPPEQNTGVDDADKANKADKEVIIID